MKGIIKSICLVLVMATLLSTSVYAQSPEEPTGTYSVYFNRYCAYCWQTTDGQFEVWFDVTAKGTMEKLGVEKIKIQKSSDGENWLTVMTFLSSYYDYLLGENAGFYSNHVSYTGVSGYYYRAYVTFYAENSSGVGKISEYTQPIYLGG